MSSFDNYPFKDDSIFTVENPLFSSENPLFSSENISISSQDLYSSSRQDSVFSDENPLLLKDNSLFSSENSLFSTEKSSSLEVKTEEKTSSGIWNLLVISFVVILLILFVALIVMWFNGGKNNNPGSECSTNGDCSAGCVCHGGQCMIPTGSSCSGYSSQCVAGSSCINGVCRVDGEPTVVTMPNTNTNLNTPMVGASSYQSLSITDTLNAPSNIVYSSNNISDRFITAFMYNNSVYLLNQGGLRLMQYATPKEMFNNTPTYTYVLNRRLTNLVIAGDCMYSIYNGTVVSSSIPISRTVTNTRRNRETVQINFADSTIGTNNIPIINQSRGRNSTSSWFNRAPREVADVEFSTNGQIGNFIASNGKDYVVANQPVILGNNGERLEYNGESYMLYSKNDQLISEINRQYTDFETVTASSPFITNGGEVVFLPNKTLEFNGKYLSMSQILS